MDIKIPSLGTTRVDGVGQSVQQTHTVLAEWTSRNIPGDDKKKQINKYLSVTEEILSAIGVTPKAATKNSTWLILSPGSEENYKGFIDETSRDKLMISTYGLTQDGNYGLIYHEGEMLDAALSSILKRDITIKRIPSGYAKISIDDTSLKGMAKEVVIDVLARFVQGRYEVSEEEICRGVYELWGNIGPAAKHDIIIGVRNVLREMLRKEYLRGWISRVSENPHVWSIAIPPNKDMNLVGRQFRLALDRFIADVYGKIPRQKDFFEEELNETL